MTITADTLARLCPADQWTYWKTVYDTALAGSGAARSSRELHARTLAAFAAFTAPARPFAVTPVDVLAWLGHQATAPTTWRTRRASLRGFYAWAVDAGHLPANPVSPVPSVRPLVLAPPAAAAPKPAGPARTRSMARTARRLRPLPHHASPARHDPTHPPRTPQPRRPCPGFSAGRSHP